MTRLTRLTTAGFLLSFTGLVGLIVCLVAIDQRRTWSRRSDDGGWAVAGVLIASLSMLVTCGIVGDHCG
jgi:purine-cytosine permease-like protein